MNPILEVKNLSKSYKDTQVVKNISFEVEEGEIFGILGPNGAGKTTTLEIIEGLRANQKGEIKISGLNLEKSNRSQIQQKIGIQLQSSSYFDLLSLEEILDLFGSFYEHSIPPKELLEMVDLYDKRKNLVKNLSGGQAQRFSIVAALVNDPDLIFLDEPTTGLDPQIRRSLWDVIRNIHNKGKTLILTTHYMEEAEELCSRVAIMDGGEIIALDTPVNLITQLGLKFTIKFATQEVMTNPQISEFENHPLVKKFWKDSNKYIFRIEDPTKINDILNWLEKNKIKFKNLEIIPPNLEDVFLKLTGKSLK